jgi:hypothetical protein
MLLLILLDAVGSTVLLLRLGSGEELRETLIDQVSLSLRPFTHYINITWHYRSILISFVPADHSFQHWCVIV